MASRRKGTGKGGKVGKGIYECDADETYIDDPTRVHEGAGADADEAWWPPTLTSPSVFDRR